MTDVYEVVVVMDLGSGNEALNVMHYEFPDAPPTTVELQNFTDQIVSAYENDLQADLHTTVSMGEVRFRDRLIGNSPQITYNATGGGFTGTNTGNQLPPETVLNVSWKAQTTFPRTSRAYISGFTETTNDPTGVPDAALLAAALSFAGNIAGLTLSSGNQAFKLAAQLGGTPLVATNWNRTNIPTVSPRWAIQKRRRK